MNRRSLTGLTLMILVAVLLPVGQAAGDSVSQLIVVLKESANPQAVANDHTRKYGVTVHYVYRKALKGYAGAIPSQSVGAVSSDARVLYVTPDEVVQAPNPEPEIVPVPPGGGGLQPERPRAGGAQRGDGTQVVPRNIRRVDAELSPTADIDGIDDDRVDVDVAVIDTGIDSHPDLNVVGGVACGPGRKGFRDLDGHGTHVAGTVAAIDNSTGVVGVAPGARLWAVRVFGKRTSSVSHILCGIEWVTATRLDSDPGNDIEVANMSLGHRGADDGNCGLTTRDVWHQAICKSVAAGVTYVVAAGNESQDSANARPAAYDEVITVSAMTDTDGEPGGLGSPDICFEEFEDDTFAFFSNFGADVDLTAPGVCIGSTWIDGLFALVTGTSMSSPMVAGGAALYIATHPGASPAQVKAALISAGTFDYESDEDPDGIKEPLLNVGSL